MINIIITSLHFVTMRYINWHLYLHTFCFD